MKKLCLLLILLLTTSGRMYQVITEYAPMSEKVLSCIKQNKQRLNVLYVADEHNKASVDTLLQTISCAGRKVSVFLVSADSTLCNSNAADTFIIFDSMMYNAYAEKNKVIFFTRALTVVAKIPVSTPNMDTIIYFLEKRYH